MSALLKSVARGLNVIDTARNYRRGRAEAAVGEALATLTSRGLRREQLFISTKAGYLSGADRRCPLIASVLGPGRPLCNNPISMMNVRSH